MSRTTSDRLYHLATSSTHTTRNRFSNAQIVVLEQLFHNNSHPSLEERELLAKDVDMEVQSVTIWFQNKRQTERRATSRRARKTQLDTITNTTTTRPYRKQLSATSRASSSSASTSASRRPSLDRVASRSELRAPAPRTPSRRHNPTAPLWENMASSPIAPPSSSPAREFVEFGQGQRMRTLEWACARRRLTSKDDENAGVPGLLLDADGDTDVELEEAVTPPSSCNSSWSGSARSKAGEPDEDTMKAALALCGLMRG